MPHYLDAGRVKSKFEPEQNRDRGRKIGARDNEMSNILDKVMGKDAQTKLKPY